MFNETDVLKELKERFKSSSEDVLIDIGDDCAAIRSGVNNLLLISTDSLVEDVHFLKPYFKPEEIAKKSVAVSISDIASMGGRPKFILSTIGFPKCSDRKLMNGLLQGIKGSCELYNVDLIGGNVTTSKKLFLNITVIGQIEKDRVVRRSGAEADDLVFVTGNLGDSALGLKVLQSEEKIEDKSIINAHKDPQPRIEVGRELSGSGLASSMIDVSDGLLIDLERITTEQGVGAKIYTQNIPLSASYLSLISRFEEDPLKLAVTGGEDYELLFTSPPDCRDRIKELEISTGIRISEIGVIVREKKIKLFDKGGNTLSYRKSGFVHVV